MSFKRFTEGPEKPEPTRRSITFRVTGGNDQTARRITSLTAAADYAGCSRRTLRRYIDDGSLPGLKFGPRMVRVDLDDIDRLLMPIEPADVADDGEQPGEEIGGVESQRPAPSAVTVTTVNGPPGGQLDDLGSDIGERAQDAP